MEAEGPNNLFFYFQSWNSPIFSPPNPLLHTNTSSGICELSMCSHVPAAPVYESYLLIRYQAHWEGGSAGAHEFRGSTSQTRKKTEGVPWARQTN